MLDLAPHLTKEEIQNLSRSTEDSNKQHFFNKNKGAKDNYVKSLTSNIFNDPV
jgi:hypothetical protein